MINHVLDEHGNVLVIEGSSNVDVVDGGLLAVDVEDDLLIPDSSGVALLGSLLPRPLLLLLRLRFALLLADGELSHLLVQLLRRDRHDRDSRLGGGNCHHGLGCSRGLRVKGSGRGQAARRHGVVVHGRRGHSAAASDHRRVAHGHGGLAARRRLP